MTIGHSARLCAAWKICGIGVPGRSVGVARRAPIGIKLLALFFAFGACMCALTIVLLSFPGGALEPIWRINPEAQAEFQVLGGWSIVLMATVGTACGFATVGLARGRRWGRQLALAILVVNVTGDLVNAMVRHDWRTLIGLPLGGAMIAYLLKTGPVSERRETLEGHSINRNP